MITKLVLTSGQSGKERHILATDTNAIKPKGKVGYSAFVSFR